MPVTPLLNLSKLPLTLVILLSLTGCGGSGSNNNDDKNQAPVAEDDNLTTDEDTVLSISLAATDEDGSISSFNITAQPGYGTLTGTAPDLVYTPDTDYSGNDRFSFSVTDDDGETSNTASVSISVNPVNDLPTAQAENVSLDEGNSTSIKLSGNDIDGTISSYAIVSNPENGFLSGSAPNLTYTPNSNFNGNDSFSFRVTDNDGGESAAMDVAITVNAADDPPSAQAQNIVLNEDSAIAITLSGNDPDDTITGFTTLSNPANGSLNGTPPNLTYTPNADYFGSDSFTFNVTNSNGLDSASATIAINVSAVNDMPGFSSGGNRWIDEDAGTQYFTAWASAVSTGPANELTQTVSFVLSNDNNALFSVQPTVSSNGTLSFTTAANAFGRANVSIRIQDNGGTANGGENISAAQRFVVQVHPQNDALSITASGLPAANGATVNAELITNSITAGLLQYNWQASGDWSISGGQATSQLNLLAPATSSGDSVTLSATGNTTANLVTDLPLSLIGDNTPVISQLGLTPQADSDTWQLDVSASDPNMLALSYAWNSGGLSIGNTASTNWTVPVSGQYRITANADNAGQNASGSIEIWHTARAPGMFFRGSRQGTGSRYPVDTSGNRGQQKWRRVIAAPDCSLNFNFVSGLSQGQDGTLYLGSSSEPRLYAIDPENGDVQWFFEVTGSDFKSTPAIAADGTIYVVERVSGTVYAINPDGNERWNYTLGANVTSPIALGPNGSLYIGTDNTTASVLVALNDDGSEKWATPFALNNVTRGSVNFGANGTIYARTYQGYVYAIDPDSGTQVWRSPLLGSGSGSSPVVATDGTIYFGSFSAGDKFFALNADGTPKWGSNLGSPSIAGIGATASIGNDGTVYIGAWEPGNLGAMYALDPTDGSQLWRHALNGIVQSSSSAIGADGTIYVASQQGKLYALDPATGNEHWTYDFQASPAEDSPGPLLIGADGTIYTYTCDGAVHAIE